MKIVYHKAVQVQIMHTILIIKSVKLIQTSDFEGSSKLPTKSACARELSHHILAFPLLRTWYFIVFINVPQLVLALVILGQLLQLRHICTSLLIVQCTQVKSACTCMR